MIHINIDYKSFSFQFNLPLSCLGQHECTVFLDFVGQSLGLSLGIDALKLRKK